MPIQKRPVHSLDDINQRRRDRETLNQVLDHSFDDSRKQTPAEVAAGVTPINKAYPPCNVRRYGAVGDGVTDDTAAIIAAISVAQANLIGGYVHIPGGIYLVSSTLAVSHDRIHIYGDGVDASRIVFAPTANDTLLEFNNGATSVWQCSVSDITLYSNDSTYTKVALDLYDIRTFVCERVWIGGSVGISGSAYWAGNSASIGVRTHGREFGTFRDMLVASDRPIVIGLNPNDSRHTDHFHFSNLFLIANANPVVEVESGGVNVTNLIFDGHQSWNLGTYGFYWVDSSAPSVSSYALIFKNVRTEQGTDAAAQTFHIEIHSSATLQNVLFENCYLDSARPGMYMRRVERITMDHAVYPGTSKVAIDVTAISNTYLVTRNCFFNTGSTATLTNLRAIIGTPNAPSQALFANGEYGYDANSTRNLTFGGAIGETAFTLANDASVAIGTTTMLGRLTVVTTSVDNTWADFNVRGTNNVTAEIADPQGVYTITKDNAGTTNVYWDTSAYYIQNKRGTSRNYRIILLGVYN